MFSRPVLFVGVLLAAIAVPYILLDENLSRTVREQYRKWSGAGPAAAGSAGESSSPWGDFSWSSLTSQANPAASATAPSGPLTSLPKPVAMEEAFQMEATPQWVVSRFPRVTTVLGETEQMTLRTPLVTGVAPDDVAGSLTYYFDNRHVLQRITFQGLTGDERRFTELLRKRFGLQAEPTLLAGEYAAAVGPKTSRLRVAHLPVVRANAPLARAEVALDLYRPGAPPATTAAAKPQQPSARPPFRSW